MNLYFKQHLILYLIPMSYSHKKNQNQIINLTKFYHNELK